MTGDQFQVALQALGDQAKSLAAAWAAAHPDRPELGTLCIVGHFLHSSGVRSYDPDVCGALLSLMREVERLCPGEDCRSERERRRDHQTRGDQ